MGKLYRSLAYRRVVISFLVVLSLFFEVNNATSLPLLSTAGSVATEASLANSLIDHHGSDEATLEASEISPPKYSPSQEADNSREEAAKDSATYNTEEPDIDRHPRIGLITEAAASDLHVIDELSTDEQIARAMSGNYNSYESHRLVLEQPNAPVLDARHSSRRYGTYIHGPTTEISRGTQISQRLLRIDTRPPGIIFRDGFRPWGSGTNDNGVDGNIVSNDHSDLRLWEHSQGIRENSVGRSYLIHSSLFVSASFIQNLDNLHTQQFFYSSAAESETGEVWVYEIHAPGGVPVDRAFYHVFGESPNLQYGEQEIDFLGGIDTRYIRTARQYVDGEGYYGYARGTDIVENSLFDPYLYSSYGHRISDPDIDLPEINVNSSVEYWNNFYFLPALASVASISHMGCSSNSPNISDLENNAIEHAGDNPDVCFIHTPDWGNTRQIEDRTKIGKETITFGSDNFRQPNGYYRISPLGSSQVLTVLEDRIRGKVALDTSLSFAGEWLIEYDRRDESYLIRSSLNPHLLLESDGRGRLFLAPDTNHRGQRWDIAKDLFDPIDLRTITNRQHGWKLDLGSGSSWSLEHVDNSLGIGEAFFVLPNEDPNKAITFKDDKQSSETVVNNASLRDYLGGLVQQLVFNFDESRQTFSISPRADTGLALDIVGEKVEFVTRNIDSITQEWRVYVGRHGEFYLENLEHPGLVLERYQDGRLGIGKFIENKKEQKWDLAKRSVRPISDGRYRVASSDNSNYLIDGSSNSIEVSLSVRANSNAQRWDIVYHDSLGKYSLESVESPGQYLVWDTDRQILDTKKCVSSDLSGCSEYYWILEHDGDGLITMRTLADSSEEKVLTSSVDPAKDGSLKVSLYESENNSQRLIFENMGNVLNLADKSFHILHGESEALSAAISLIDLPNDSNGNLTPASLNFFAESIRGNNSFSFIYDKEMLAYRIILNGSDNDPIFLVLFEGLLYATTDYSEDVLWDIFENPDGSVQITNRNNPHIGTLTPNELEIGSSIKGVEASFNARATSWNVVEKVEFEDAPLFENRVKIVNSAFQYMVLGEDRVRTRVIAHNNPDIMSDHSKLWEHWDLSDTGRGYIISSAVKSGLVLEMDKDGRVFMGIRDDSNSAQRWQTTDSEAWKGDFIYNMEYQAFGLTVESGTLVGKKFLSTGFWSEYSAWNLEQVDDFLVEDNYFLRTMDDKQEKALTYNNQQNNTPISIDSFAGTKYQQLIIRRDAQYNGYRILSKIDDQDSLALRVSDRNTGGVAFVDQKDSLDQLWRIFREDNGKYRLENMAYSGMVLSADSSNKICAILLESNRQCGGGIANVRSLQSWDFVYHNLRPIKDGAHVFRSSQSFNKLFDVRKNNIVSFWDRNYDDNQKWHIKYDGNKKAYRIGSSKNDEMFLRWDYTNDELVLGNNNDDFEYWRLETTNRGNIILRSFAENRSMVLGVSSLINDDSLFWMAPIKYISDLQNNWHDQQLMIFESLESLPQLEYDIHDNYAIFADECNIQKIVCTSDYAMSMSGPQGNNSRGARLALENNQGVYDSTSRQFNFEYSDARNFHHIHMIEWGKYIVYGDKDEGPILHDSPKWDSNETKWHIVESAIGGYTLINLSVSNRVVEIPVDEGPLVYFRLDDTNNIGLPLWDIYSLDGLGPSNKNVIRSPQQHGPGDLSEFDQIADDLVIGIDLADNETNLSKNVNDSIPINLQRFEEIRAQHWSFTSIEEELEMWRIRNRGITSSDEYDSRASGFSGDADILVERLRAAVLEYDSDLNLSDYVFISSMGRYITWDEANGSVVVRDFGDNVDWNADDDEILRGLLKQLWYKKQHISESKNGTVARGSHSFMENIAHSNISDTSRIMDSEVSDGSDQVRFINFAASQILDNASQTGDVQEKCLTRNPDDLIHGGAINLEDCVDIKNAASEDILEHQLWETSSANNSGDSSTPDARVRLDVASLVEGDSGVGYSFSGGVLEFSQDADGRVFELFSSSMTGNRVRVVDGAQVVVVFGGLGLIGAQPFEIASGSNVGVFVAEGSENFVVGLEDAAILVGSKSLLLVGNDVGQSVGEMFSELARASSESGDGIDMGIITDTNTDRAAGGAEIETDSGTVSALDTGATPGSGAGSLQVRGISGAAVSQDSGARVAILSGTDFLAVARATTPFSGGVENNHGNGRVVSFELVDNAGLLGDSGVFRVEQDGSVVREFGGGFGSIRGQDLPFSALYTVGSEGDVVSPVRMSVTSSGSGDVVDLFEQDSGGKDFFATTSFVPVVAVIDWNVGLPVPEGLIVSGTTHNSVSLVWGHVNVEGANYEVEMNGGVPFFVGANNFTTFQWLTHNTNYTFRVRAVVGGVRSDWSAPVVGRTQGIPLPPPPVVHHVEVGVTVVGSLLDVVLGDVPFGSWVSSVSNVPPGLNVSIVGGRLVLRGAPLSVGDARVMNIRVVFANGVTHVYDSRIQVVSANGVGGVERIFGRVGSVVDWYGFYDSPAAGYGGYGELASIDPRLGGVKFFSQNSYWCSPVWPFGCWGGSYVGFRGSFSHVGAFRAVVNHMGVTALCGPIFDGCRIRGVFHVNEHMFYVCERDALVCGRN